MQYLKAEMKRPLTLISCGHFISEKPWIHTKRNLDSYEVIIGTGGTAFIEQDDERYEVTPKNVLLLLPGHTHKGYAVSQQETSFYWMHFKCSGKWELIDENEASSHINAIKINPCFEGLSESILVPLFMKVSNHERLTIQFRQLMHSDKSNCYSDYVNDYMLTLILMELTQQFIDLTIQKSPEKGDSRINIILEWLHINLDKNISVAGLANQFRLNKDYLARYFKKHTGMSILQYICAMRMQKAKELLCESSMGIKEIAYMLGFTDDKYFMKQFKTSEKITPSEYRNTFYKVHLNNT